MRAGKTPLRRCVGCREMIEKPVLLRVTKGCGDDLIIDKTGKHGGRGAYLCRNIGCINKAQKIKGLERSLKRQVPKEIFTQLALEAER